MSPADSGSGDGGLTRRKLLGSAASAAAAGLALGRAGRAKAAAARPAPAAKHAADDLNVALIGAGTQGYALLAQMLKMSGPRLKAVCDIWPYRADRAWRILGRYGHEAVIHTDCQDMLADVKDLNAAVIATPDWMHAEQAIACMKAGLHVYCEMPMSHDVQQARLMAQTARQTGKLLQIGHQRRSNPLYVRARDYVRRKKALGQITHVQGHCHRLLGPHRACPACGAIDRFALRRYGYESMDHLYNWRRYRRHCGGLMASVGSQQVDVLNWFLQAPPSLVQAAGGSDYQEDTQWWDNVSALLTWEYDWGGRKCPARGVYQALTTSTHGSDFETFLGDEGSLVISESDHVGSGIRREEGAPWADWEDAKEMADATFPREQCKANAPPRQLRPGEIERVGCSEGPLYRVYSIPMPPDWERQPHWWHLENFFAAVREPGKVKLNCPPQVGLANVIVARAVQEAAETRSAVGLSADQFQT